MPLRADHLTGGRPHASGAPRAVASRERIEFVLRLIALLALVAGVLLISGVLGDAQGRSAANPVVFSTAADSTRTQPALLTTIRQLLASDARQLPLHVLATTVPSDTTRALLAAARSAGLSVSWTDSARNAAVAIEANSLIDPKGGVSLRAAAPPGLAMALRDSVGLIDSVIARGGGASITVGRVAGSVALMSTGALATTKVPPAAVIRRVLLVASPGWEAKFTAAALEERGWTVDVRYALGKNVQVTQGNALTPDTARYAVVVALDSAALLQTAAIRRYAQSGGGVVIAGAAATLPFGEMLPGRAGAEQPGVPGALAGATPLLGLSWRPIAADSDAVVLARSTRRGGTSAQGALASATMVARRYGAGRVMQIAYDDSWEWRMSGPDGSVEAHRQWWSDIVSAVAFAPTSSDASKGVSVATLPGNAAPYADIMARLGKPVAMPAQNASLAVSRPWELLLLSVAALALVLEWGSRRLRGAR